MVVTVLRFTDTCGIHFKVKGDWGVAEARRLAPEHRVLTYRDVTPATKP